MKLEYPVVTPAKSNGEVTMNENQRSPTEENEGKKGEQQQYQQGEPESSESETSDWEICERISPSKRVTYVTSEEPDPVGPKCESHETSPLEEKEANEHSAVNANTPDTSSQQASVSQVHSSGEDDSGSTQPTLQSPTMTNSKLDELRNQLSLSTPAV